MKEQPDIRSSKTRKPYEKPVLRNVALRPDEAVLLGCKMAAGGSAPLDPVSCVGNFCAVAGS